MLQETFVAIILVKGGLSFFCFVFPFFLFCLKFQEEGGERGTSKSRRGGGGGGGGVEG